MATDPKNPTVPPIPEALPNAPLAYENPDFLDSPFVIDVSSSPHSACRLPFDTDQIGFMAPPFWSFPVSKTKRMHRNFARKSLTA